MTTAIILAGGFGTRLRSVLGDEVPKPLADIAGAPFLSYLIRYFAKQGVSKVILLLYYHAEQFKAFFGDCYEGVLMHYITEPVPLGTGGALSHAFSLLPSECASEKAILVANGDTFLQCDLQALLAAHKGKITMAVQHCEAADRYGQIHMAGDIITHMDEKPKQIQECWINGGLYAVSPTIFEGFNLPESFSFEHDFLMPHIAALQPVAYKTNGYFIDIGVPHDYTLAVQKIPHWVGKNGD